MTKKWRKCSSGWCQVHFHICSSFCKLCESCAWTAAWQQSDIMSKGLFHIFHYTHPPTIFRTLLLLQSKFWFDYSRRVMLNIVIRNISLKFVTNCSEIRKLTNKSHFSNWLSAACTIMPNCNVLQYFFGSMRCFMLQSDNCILQQRFS